MSLRCIAAAIILCAGLVHAEAQQTKRFQAFPDLRDLDAEEERAEREMRAIAMIADPLQSLQRYVVHLMLMQVSVLTPLQCESAKGVLDARADEWKNANPHFFGQAVSLQNDLCKPESVGPAKPPAQR